MVRHALVVVEENGKKNLKVVDVFDDRSKAWKEARKLTRAHRGRVVYGVRPIKAPVTEMVMGGR